jgi:hypothetical protein
MSDFTHVHPSSHILFELSDEARVVACARDLWIPHPSAESLMNRMNFLMKFTHKINAPSMLIIGPGGSGKTSMIEEMKARNQFSDSKMVFVTMHQSPNGYSLKDLILQELGLGVGKRARQGDNISPEMQYIIKSRNLRAIVIDEIHDALTLTEVQQRINLSLLKNLAGSSYGLSVFAFGVPDAARVLRRDPQLARRYAVRSLNRWGNDNDFRSFAASYINRLPLKKPTNFKDQRLFLKIMEKGQGLTDNIVKILQASAMAAINDRSEHINHRHLDAIEDIMNDFCMAFRDVDELERSMSTE